MTLVCTAWNTPTSRNWQKEKKYTGYTCQKNTGMPLAFTSVDVSLKSAPKLDAKLHPSCSLVMHQQYRQSRRLTKHCDHAHSAETNMPLYTTAPFPWHS